MVTMKNRRENNNRPIFTKIVYAKSILIISCFLLMPITSISIDVKAAPQGVDMDNSGIHIIRDDDGTKESAQWLHYDHSFYKRLWVYDNSWRDADDLRVWIYARLNEPAPDVLTHEIYINNYLVKTIKAREYWVPQYFTWGSISLGTRDIELGSCNEIRIRGSYDDCPLEIGIDMTFNKVEGPPHVWDFDRSYYDSIAPTAFDGEWMIYLEYIANYEVLCEGYNSYENKLDWKEIKESAAGKDWDSVGYVLDWTNVNQATFELIYLVRLWIYCKPSGSVDTSSDTDIKVYVNDHNIKFFNPYKQLPREWSWFILDIYNRGDSNNQHLDHSQQNHIYLKANPGDSTENNLKISKLPQGTLDNDLTWWYLNLGGGQFDGAYQTPGQCAGELAIYIQVMMSDELKDQNAILYRYGGSSITNNRDLDFTNDGYDVAKAVNALTDFNNEPGWGNNFLIRQDEVRQWVIYGEKRSYSDIRCGDLCDLYIHYGPGKADTIALYELRIINGQWLIGEDDFHNNDDYHDFTASGTTLTEAENNDEIVNRDVEDDGSNGFDFDLEWIFFMSPNVFDNGVNSILQSLLWHNAHGIFGFQDIDDVDNLNNIIMDLNWWLDRNPVVNAFDFVCDWYDETGYYFYNFVCLGEWIWGRGAPGNPPGAYPDCIDRSQIIYGDTG